MKADAAARLQEAKDHFIAEWGAMGNAWGINRTMAQIHALLMVTPRALTTDEVMQELKISRGNAHGNLRELVGWGLIRSVIRKGERKEYFEAEKEVWKMFCIIVRERQRREIEPVLQTLARCQEQVKEVEGPEAAAFNKQLKSLNEFVKTTNALMDRVSRSSENQLMPLVMKYMK